MKLHTSTNDVHIVGGGIIGLTLAWRLASEGRNVTLIDRGLMGRGTSWAGAGILPPANFDNASDPIDSLRGLSHQLFSEWTLELESQTNLDPGLRKCGGWYLADSPGEKASMIGLSDYWAELQIEVNEVALSELAVREPALAQWSKGENAHGAWWVPDEFQLQTRNYIHCIKEACMYQGVRLRENCQVTKVRESQSKPQIMIDNQWHTSDQLILCGGTWLGQFTENFGLEKSLIPVRGQILFLESREIDCRRIINVGHRYLACRGDGTILVGSCEEEVGFQLGTTEYVRQDLLAFAHNLIPELQNAQTLDFWSGLRPMTFDGFPMIGRIPHTVNTYIACGHFRSGLHLSTGTASVLTDLLQGRVPIINLEPFRVGKQIT